jgi:hypothetical protein
MGIDGDRGRPPMGLAIVWGHGDAEAVAIAAVFQRAVMLPPVDTGRRISTMPI